MKNQKIIFLYLAITLGCSSCATLFNRSHQVVTVRSTRPVKLIFQGDTLQRTPQIESQFIIKKAKQSYNLVLFNDSTLRSLNIQYKKSWTYGLNLFTPYLGGLLVDEISGKKFTYPKKIFVDIANQETPYLPYFPMSTDRLKYKNQISFSPSSLIGDYHPGIELGYQRQHDSRFATKFNLRYFTPKNNNFARNASGFKFEIVPKYYIRNQEKTRIYTALSIEYLRKDHEAAYDFWIPENFDDDDFTNDSFSQILPVEKRFISFTPRIGIEHYLSDRLVLDAFFGIGLRYRETRVTGANPNFDLSISNDGWFDYTNDSNRPDKRLSPNLDFNFSIGWVF